MFLVFLPLILASTILASPLAREDKRQYFVYNRCPMAIDLYIGGVTQDTIPANGSALKILGIDAGYFFTNVNGGAPNGNGTIRAGFYNDYYYLISDPNYANTGMRVKPKDRSQPYANSFCEEIQCDGLGCPQAFTQPPTSFPDPASTEPSPPYYRCPISNPDYEITFCPTGQFPDQPEGRAIHFDNVQNKCLDVQGAVFANGTPVQVYDCNGTQAQRWNINSGSTKVQLAGTDFCLDAGTSPADGVQLKIWQCYDNLPAQQWYYTADNRIALEGGFCVDLDNGITTSDSMARVQTWTCSDNNNNQVWNL